MKNSYFNTSKYLLLFIGYIFFYNSSLAQQNIQVIINNSPTEYYYFQQVKGERLIMIDSAICENDSLVFNQINDLEKGMYFIQNKYQGFIFLLNEKNLKFETTWSFIEDSLKIIKSEENNLWADYQIKKEQSFKNLDLLNPILNWYDKKSKFYKSAVKEFTKVQDEFFEYTDNIPENTLAYSYIQADIKPRLPIDMTYEEQKAYFIKHWFDRIDWYDHSLIYSNILTTKITEYLGLYGNKDYSKSEIQQAFKVAVDQIIPLTMDNPEMYAFIMDYLVRGFERYDMQDVILHIAINYTPPSEQCENEDIESEALERLKKYEQLSIGNPAPEIILPNLMGDTIKLSEMTSDKTLIVFWASWCPHCTQLIPQLEEWYQAAKLEGWSLMAISIDSKKEDLENLVKELNLNIPILSDYKGWDSPSAKDYNIYATPTMIVVDSEMNIIGKPSNMEDLRAY
jgi:peroxiredoxin/predicted DNA-binding protein YlxM (UPF0122 family)